MVSRIEQLQQVIREHPIFRLYIPIEAGIGWPIPVHRNNRLYATLPFFGYHPVPGQHHSAIFPPFATMTLDLLNGAVVEYTNLRIHNPWSDERWEGQVGVFPQPELAGMTIGQYRAQRRKLLAMYDSLFEWLCMDVAFEPDWIRHFAELLRVMIEPGLEPYYRAIGPEFFARFVDGAAQT